MSSTPPQTAPVGPAHSTPARRAAQRRPPAPDPLHEKNVTPTGSDRADREARVRAMLSDPHSRNP